ncbi:MAG: polyprenyl synthetase family protein [Actinobacteria bacterium]|nr:polyprenyl synthetase family protein [Actinomycetota bacterium]
MANVAGRSQLRRAETEMAKAIEAFGLRDACLHLLGSSGKQIRANLLGLAAQQGRGGDIRTIGSAAEAVELLHLASLAHDDIIDSGELRRGELTTRARYGQRYAALAGGWVLCSAVKRILPCSDSARMRFSKTAVEMSGGGMLELTDVGNLGRTEADYLEASKRKTATIMSLAAYLGAELSGAPEGIVAAACQFGNDVGMALQIWDDLLDVSGKFARPDKTAANDLRNGVINLPTIYALAESRRLRERMSDREATPAELAELIIRTSGPDRAAACADEYASSALKAIDALPRKEGFREILEFVRKEYRSPAAPAAEHRTPSSRGAPGSSPRSKAVPATFQENRGSGVKRLSKLHSQTPVFAVAERNALCFADTLTKLNANAMSALTTASNVADEALLGDFLSGHGPVAAWLCILAEESYAKEPGTESSAVGLAFELSRVAVNCLMRVNETPDLISQTQTNGMTVLAADHAFSHGLAVASSCDAEAVEQLFRATQSAICGAGIDAEDEGNSRRSTERYFAAACLNDGELHARAAGFGSHLARAPEDVQSHLSEYGRKLGIALRISNDVIRLVNGDPATNRTPGFDLIRGNITLPVIFAAEEDPELAGLLTGNVNDSSVREALSRVCDTTAVSRCLAECDQYESAARDELDGLDLHRNGLDALTELASSRIRDLSTAG